MNDFFDTHFDQATKSGFFTFCRVGTTQAKKSRESLNVKATVLYGYPGHISIFSFWAREKSEWKILAEKTVSEESFGAAIN